MIDAASLYRELYLVELPDEVGRPEWRDQKTENFTVGMDVVWARGYFFARESGQSHIWPAVVELNESLRSHPDFVLVLQSFVDSGQSIVVIRELSKGQPLTDDEVSLLAFGHVDDDAKLQVLLHVRSKLTADQESPKHSYLQYNIDSAIGAAHLFREAQNGLAKGKEDDIKKLELQEISLQAAITLRRVFLHFHAIGKASKFLDLFSVRPDWEHEPTAAIISELQLFSALAIAASHLESQKRKEGNTDQNCFIATVGRNNSGKGIVTEYLREKYGFTAEPLSNRVREYAAAQGYTLPFDRQALIDTGLRVKALFGESVLIRTAIAQLFAEGKENRLLFDGLRAEGEALEILELRNQNTPTICISVMASEDEEEDLKIRFQRALIRGGDKDPKQDSPEEFERFKQLDQRESAGIEAARKHATHTVINRDNQQEATFQQIDEIMAEFGIQPLSNMKTV